MNELTSARSISKYIGIFLIPLPASLATDRTPKPALCNSISLSKEPRASMMDQVPNVSLPAEATTGAAGALEVGSTAKDATSTRPFFPPNPSSTDSGALTSAVQKPSEKNLYFITVSIGTTVLYSQPFSTFTIGISLASQLVKSPRIVTSCAFGLP